MITASEARGVSQNVDSNIELLERLVADLKRIRDGQGPTEDELAISPIIHEHKVVSRPAPALHGVILGHPTLGNTVGVTSELWVVAPDWGWVRTLSRFYRLGDKIRFDGGDRD